MDRERELEEALSEYVKMDSHLWAAVSGRAVAQRYQEGVNQARILLGEDLNTGKD